MSEFLDETTRVEVDGASLYAEQVGPADAPLLYYLHGGPGYSSHSFRELLEDELERYRMIYADQRGGGRSPGNTTADLTLLASDVISIFDALGLEQSTLLAHGYGAAIAIRCAHLHPARITRLILVNPWVDMPRLARTMQRTAALLSDNLELALPPESAIATDDHLDPDKLLEQAFKWTPSKQLFDQLAFPKPASRLRLEHADSNAIIGQPAGDTPTGLWSTRVAADMKELSLPVVVLVGNEDKTCYPDQAELVLEAMPHALFSLLEAGHYPWLDDPDTFIDLLQQVMEAETFC